MGKELKSYRMSIVLVIFYARRQQFTKALNGDEQHQRDGQFKWRTFKVQGQKIIKKKYFTNSKFSSTVQLYMYYFGVEYFSS